MGKERIAAGVRAVALDAGALIAFERGREAVAVIVAQAEALDMELVIPATALAQAWRGGPRSASLAMLIDGANVEPLDERRAKQVGERLGQRGTTDVADAHVVCTALDRDASILTSDPDDIAGLTQADETLEIVPV